MTQLGLILECGPAGADEQVFKFLLKHLKPHLTIVPITMGDKPRLLNGCGLVAAELLSNGCERLLIVWDLYPAWRERGQTPCRKKDREMIFESLNETGISPHQVVLLCIRAELESWLIADESNVTQFVATQCHPHQPCRANSVKRPEQNNNPKKYLHQYFQSTLGRKYNDAWDAKPLIQGANLGIIERKCPSFKRLKDKL